MQRKDRHALRKNAGGKRLMVGMQFTKTIPRANTRGAEFSLAKAKQYHQNFHLQTFRFYDLD